MIYQVNEDEVECVRKKKNVTERVDENEKEKGIRTAQNPVTFPVVIWTVSEQVWKAPVIAHTVSTNVTDREVTLNFEAETVTC